MDHSIRIATASDADRIAEIYNHYVANTVVTFEEEAVGADEMRRRMDEASVSALPWLVAESGGCIGADWAAVSTRNCSVC